jgi:hypothetical protein
MLRIARILLTYRPLLSLSPDGLLRDAVVVDKDTANNALLQDTSFRVLYHPHTRIPATCLQNRTLSYILRCTSWNVARNGQN